MGVIDFSKTFLPLRALSLNEIQHKKIAIDMTGEIWRACLGGKSVNMLTDAQGKPTMHISVILSNIIAFAVAGIDIICCFDYDDNEGEDNQEKREFHNNLKIEEIEKRRKGKEKAANKLEDLKKTLTASSISDDEDEADEIKVEKRILTEDEEKSKRAEIQSLEKRTFQMSREYIEDIKFMLDCLNIKHTTAPRGFEGEFIAVCLEKNGFVNAVLSGDTDSIPFGARNFYRRNNVRDRKKQFLFYTQENIINQITIKKDPEKRLKAKRENYNADDFDIEANKTEVASYDPEDDDAAFPSPRKNTENAVGIKDIRKICVLLGCDFVKREKGYGPVKVISNYESTKLDKRQTDAFNHYAHNLEVLPIIHNADKTPFVGCEKIPHFVKWMVEVKSFSKALLLKKLKKIGIELVL